MSSHWDSLMDLNHYYTDSVNQLSRRIYIELVVPTCKKNDIVFNWTAKKGSFFTDLKTKSALTEKQVEKYQLEEILKLLNSASMDGKSLGFIVSGWLFFGTRMSLTTFPIE